jgi:hypothetical protein
MRRKNRQPQTAGAEPEETQGDEPEETQGDEPEETQGDEPAVLGSDHWAEFHARRFDLDVDTRVRHIFIIGRGGRSHELTEELPKFFAELGEYMNANELAVIHRVAELAEVEIRFTEAQLDAIAPLLTEYAAKIR